MRVSNLLLCTLKEVPHDAEIISHQLMLRAGFIRKLGSGLYSWLPLGLKILRKVENIVREEMDAIGAQELLMPAIQPAELWEETSRWEQFGPLMLKMKDRHGRGFCFGPTHEEVVTDLIRKELKSYKELPLTVYQIQTKFRDEIRPRFGVMRAREFLMKDAYSFHIDTESLQKTYKDMYQAYTNIFTRLGLKFRAVLADTGAIGGSQSHEFHVLADSGEDLIAFSDKSLYAANVELAPAPAVEYQLDYEYAPQKAIKTTIGIKPVAEQAAHLKLPLHAILKTLLVKGDDPKYPIVGLLLRGDHELNALKAEKHPLIFSPLTLISHEAVQATAHCNPGFVGPIDLNIPLLADLSVAKMKHFSCGANIDDTHFVNVNFGKDLPLPPCFDFRNVKQGDISPDNEGQLSLMCGIEVGHIFQLEDKYSLAMKAQVLNEKGSTTTLSMGCYGIGISRIVAAAIEQHHDEKGIIWPKALAPFQVVIIPINMKKSQLVQETCLKLYTALKKAGIEVLWDDRNERIGVMFADMELIGIPHRLVIGEKSLTEGKLEYKNRIDNAAQIIGINEVIPFLKDLIDETHSGPLS
ncbi:MAG: prolyl-tRNA synthetase [Francisellaceae bacterium]|nr:prolyl-tRNA synthetase [Francisellaceae bacterium]